MQLSRELKIVLPAILVLTLVLLGGYYIYKRIAPTPKSTNISTSSPRPEATGFPKATTIPKASPSPNAPVAKLQPETGLGTGDIKNIGIHLTSPKNSQKISSPLTVSGSANVFEGKVLIRIKDSNNKTIGTASATACMDIDACPFEAVVVFTKPQTQNGSVEVYSISPQNGNEEYLSRVPVSF